MVDGAKVDAEEFGDLLGRAPLPEAFHCEETPAFEFGQKLLPCVREKYAELLAASTAPDLSDLMPE